MLALSIFPGSHPPSIVDALELNFCVRDGNRWTLKPINTNSFICSCFSQAARVLYHKYANCQALFSLFSKILRSLRPTAHKKARLG